MAEDPTSDDPRIIPTFNGYSASGNVTATLVYANYGGLEDFEYLQSAGIKIQGSIVIVRYGQMYRGTKVMLAQQFGAVGVLMYSDPVDDGYIRAGAVNNTYPNGPWRPEYGVQRGSVQYWSVCPGSPSQDRVAMCLGPERANENYIGTLIPDIPVQPLSWGDAYPLLASLSNSTAAPATWQGGLNFTYGLGPSNLSVNLDLQMNFTTVTIWNVIATLKGRSSDEVVIVGNHRDAWSFGATDPNSGSAVLLETARSLAQLHKAVGWTPNRDIVFCSWDAEEYGLLGSTAWAEANAEYLQSHAVLYLNTDIGVSGKDFYVQGTPSLFEFIKDITEDAPYPADPNNTLSKYWNPSQYDILGSGSDYTVFIDHLGIPSLHLQYSSASEAGIYHSNYDSFYWMEQFGDPGFIFHEGLTQMLGLIIMRAIEAAPYPFTYSNYAQQLDSYLQQISSASPAGANFTNLKIAIGSFTQASEGIDSQSNCVRGNNTCYTDITSLNTRLVFAERKLLVNALTNSSDGLPERPWFKHVVQAPAFYNGYSAQVFPGIAQGILDNDLILVQQQIERAAITINDAALALTELTLNASSNSSILCYGDRLANVMLVTNAGFTPLQYIINGTTSQSSPIFTNLTGGSYDFYVVDAANLTSKVFVSISQPPKLGVAIKLNNSYASAFASGGVGNYSFVWASGNFSDYVAVTERGWYNVTVIDANGCIAQDSVFHDPKPTSGAGGAQIIWVLVGIVLGLGVIAVVFSFYVYRIRQEKTVYVSLKR